MVTQSVEITKFIVPKNLEVIHVLRSVNSRSDSLAKEGLSCSLAYKQTMQVSANNIDWKFRPRLQIFKEKLEKISRLKFQ